MLPEDQYSLDEREPSRDDAQDAPCGECQSTSARALIRQGDPPRPHELAAERTEFLTLLLGDGLPGGQFAHIWHRANHHTDWIQTVADAEASVGRHGRRDIYLGIGLAAERGSSSERVKSASAAGLLGLAVDVDIADARAHKHPNDDLPPDEAAARMLLDEMAAPPTCVVHSGHGLQAWWLFEQPWSFGEGERTQATKLAAKWQARLDARAGARGWTLDNVSDLARLLRVPGTLNAKNPQEPVPTRLLQVAPEHRYSPWDLLALCAAADPTPPCPSHADHPEESDIGSRRFRPGHPCPICHGHAEKPQGTGERCWGFLSRDGNVACCTREEVAGDLTPRMINLGSVVYPHQLWGPCGCGTTHAIAPQGDGPQAGRALWNVSYYVRRYHDRLRYVATLRRWYECNGKWWEPDTLNRATRLGYEAVDALYAQASEETDRNRKRELSELAVKLDTADKIAVMVRDAATFAPIATHASQFDTEDWHVVAANGIIDLATGNLLPHNPDALHSKHLGATLASIDYDPNATCPNWLVFLKQIFPESDGPEMAQYIQRAFGYTLTGSTREQKMFIAVGEGANGKSTLTDTLSALLGSYYAELATDTLLSTSQDKIPTDLAKLVGVRVAIASENEQNRYLAEALIKKATGDKAITARFMRQDFFTYQPKFKLWLHTNHKPKIRGKDKGIWRRLQVIPFTYTFRDEEKVEDYFERRLRPELPGILAWAVRGCLEWQRSGLNAPARVTAAWQEYQEQNDTLGAYLDNSVFALEGGFLSSSDVFADYCDWCRRQNEHSESQKALSLAIKRTFDVEPILRKGAGRGFVGLALAGGSDERSNGGKHAHAGLVTP